MPTSPSDSQEPRSWQRLVQNALADVPPDMDVRVAVRARLEDELALRKQAKPRWSVWGDLQMMIGMRSIQAGMVAGAVAVGLLGWRLRDVEIAFTLFGELTDTLLFNI